MTAAHHDAGSGCESCEPPQLARNHYFTGKLLVERDFRDEQRFFMGKHDRHNRLLHGWGVVCGLTVRPHPHCPEQYVVVDEGAAIDCCGRELLVPSEQHFDVRRALASAGLDVDADPAPWNFQVCLRYTECGSELVPTVFDDCPDDRSCEPNRIVQSFELSVRPFDPATDRDVAAPHLTPLVNVYAPGALRVRKDPVHDLLHVLARRSSPAVVSFSGDEYGFETIRRLQGTMEDVAVTADGVRQYVAATRSGQHRLYVAQVDSEDDPVVLTIPTAGDARVEAGTDGSAYVLTSTQLVRWTDPPNQTDADVETLLDGDDLLDIALTPDSGHAAVTDAAGRLHLVELASGTVETIMLDTTVVAADHVAVVDGPDGRLLLAVEGAAGRFGAWSLDTVAGTVERVGAPLDLSGAARALTVSPDGRWALTLVEEADASMRVQPVDVHAVVADEVVTLPAATGVRAGSRDLVLDSAGRRLFVAYQGSDAADGGVQVLTVAYRDCSGLLDIPETCPECDDDCVVLATITGYEPGEPITQPMIDTVTDRRTLPSTSALADAIRCLMESGSGGTGLQGPAGPEGPEGPAGADGAEGAEGPAGADGADGADGAPGERGADGIGLEPDYVHVSAINWPHAGSIGREDAITLFTRGILVGFDRQVLTETLTRHTVELEVRCQTDCESTPLATFAYQEVEVMVVPAPLDVDDCNHVALPPELEAEFDERMRDLLDNPPGDVNGVIIVPLHERGRPLMDDEIAQMLPTTFRVRLRGNFILGAEPMEIPVAGGGVREVHPALDGSHFAPGIPDRCPSGDMVEGGDFESWFELDFDGEDG